MKLTNLFSDSDDDRAVSPVIGVILMVAITVILAAVIGTFVLGLGDSVESAPQASFDFSVDSSDNVQIRHRGGDNIDPNNVEIRVNGEEVAANTESGGGGSAFTDLNSFGAGDSVYISSGDVGSNDDVDIVFTSGDRQDIIGSFTVPE
jgi:flagellin-like protein